MELDLDFLDRHVQKPKQRWSLRHYLEELETHQELNTSSQEAPAVFNNDNNRPSTSGVAHNNGGEHMDVDGDGQPPNDNESVVLQHAADMEWEYNIQLDSPFNRTSCSLPTVTDIVDEELPSDEEPESEQGEPETDVPKPPYFKPPDDGRCYLHCMPDETLLHIFTFLKTKDFLTTVSRVCRRWNRLCKDRSTRGAIDLSFIRMRPKVLLKAIKLVSVPSYTKRLAFKCPIRDPSTKNCRFERCTAVKCLKVAVVKEINKHKKLEHLSVSHEHIFKLDLCKILPTTLTHLSLPYCNISHERFHQIFSGDGVLRQLEYLDLTGVLVIDRYSIDEHITLPKRLKILRLKDTGRLFDSLHESISKHHSLADLDISLCRFKLEALDTISVTLVHLTSLNMVGCTVGEWHENGAVDSWAELWSHRFPSLRRLNLRNCHMGTCNKDNKTPALISSMPGSERFSWLIDVDGSRSALVQEYEELEVEEEFETEYKDCKPLLKRYISA